MQLCNFAHNVLSQKKTMFKVSNRNTRKRCLLISKIRLKTSEQRHLLPICQRLLPRTMSWTVFPRVYTNLLAIKSLLSSSTARNFNNSRLIYVILWEIITEIFDSWKFKMSLFYFWEKSPKNGHIFQLFLPYIQRTQSYVG